MNYVKNNHDVDKTYEINCNISIGVILMLHYFPYKETFMEDVETGAILVNENY